MEGDIQTPESHDSEAFLDLEQAKALIRNTIADLSELPRIDDYHRGCRDTYETVLELLKTIRNKEQTWICHSCCGLTDKSG